MAQSGWVDDETNSYPPPIPRRHPLRESSFRQASQAPTKANIRPSSGKHSPLPRPNIGPNESQLHLVSAFSTQAGGCTSLESHHKAAIMFEREKVKEKMPSNHAARFTHALRADENISLASTQNSLTDGLKRYSALLGRSNSPILSDHSEEQARRQGIDNALTKIRQSLNISETLTISSYDNGEPATRITVEDEDDDKRVETWLQRGAQNAQAPEFDSPSTLRNAPATATLHRPRALAILPSASPVTGQRECASPLSPMNNGRDAYGNFIPTNTQDYFDTPLVPTTSKLEFLAESATGVSKSSIPSLRGGGGWWRNLGIPQSGKQQVLAEQKSNSNLGNSVRNITAEISKDKGPVDIQNQYSNRTGNHSEYPQVDRAPTRTTAPSYGQTSVRVDDGWLEPTDLETEIPPPQNPRQWEPSANAQFGSVQNRRKDTLRSPTPSSPISANQINLQRDAALGKLTAPYGGGTRSPPANDIRSGHNDFGPVARKPLFPMARPASPHPETGYSPRSQKRWENDQITRSPPQSPLPPPPPRNAGPANNMVNSAAELAVRKYWQERPASNAESVDEIAYEIQSLQLGESVSVAGREYAPRAGPIQQANQLRPENFEEGQREAQIEFFPMCRKVMLSYNEEYSNNRSALQAGSMPVESYAVRMEYLTGNMESALNHSAKLSGYVILKDEVSILDAMSTPIGYAIYHELLHTTDPTLWQRLEEQHRLAQTSQDPIPVPAQSQPSHDSNLKSARRLGGKIGRFLFAAPSDPDLKTHSNRRYSNGMSGFWTAPSLATSTAPVPSPQKEKGKGKTDPNSDAISTRDFAPTTSSAVQSRYTGTTAVSPTPTPTSTPKPKPKSRTLASFNPAFNAYARPPPSFVAETEHSAWPEGDSQGNWGDVRKPQPTMRGGASSVSKEGRRVQDKKSKKRVFLEELVLGVGSGGGIRG